MYIIQIWLDYFACIFNIILNGICVNCVSEWFAIQKLNNKNINSSKNRKCQIVFCVKCLMFMFVIWRSSVAVIWCASLSPSPYTLRCVFIVDFFHSLCMCIFVKFLFHHSLLIILNAYNMRISTHFSSLSNHFKLNDFRRS